jgi:solute carrier family 39 (zinc transporter), member 1/2/3
MSGFGQETAGVLLGFSREVAIVALMAAAYLGGWVARRLAGPAQGARKASASANAAAGGFLLGAGLFHFLPDAHARLETVFPGHKLHAGFVLCAVGFTAILAIERLLFDPNAHKLEQEGAASRAPVLGVTLSSHALLSGFAVGTEQSAVTFLVVAAAISVHKFAAAFTLGSSLIRGGASSRSFLTVMLIFAVSTPLGMLLGTQVQTFLTDNAGQLVEASFEALAAGTFLYVAALDVVHDEFFHKRASWADLLLFIGGLAVMAGLSVVD